jgi:hypothetical protein
LVPSPAVYPPVEALSYPHLKPVHWNLEVKVPKQLTVEISSKLFLQSPAGPLLIGNTHNDHTAGHATNSYKEYSFFFPSKH